ncbi:MAG: alanine dehydrogenase [Pseudohongiella sp.]|nr:MAG: alanine dehydrogenase [Pseudohongiella sp.]
MKVGCPRETKDQEYRVALTPNSVRTLVDDGHEVWIEHQAGLGISCSDEDYTAAGAKIAVDADELFATAQLIVKVKEPNHVERMRLKPEHILFTYLHLASDPQQTEELLASNAVCIAYETVTDDNGRLPLLTPMSEIAGRLAVQESAAHLGKHNGGMGVLLGGATGVEAAHVVIVGGGVVGMNACKIALGLGAKVTILDTSEQRLEELQKQFSGQVNCVKSNEEKLTQYAIDADLLIGAVLVPGGAAAKLIPASLVTKMKPGSVIADVAIDQGGCCENSRPTTHRDPTFEIDGVIHYCVANIPGAVPITASEALNNATLPFIRKLASEGLAALNEDKHLRNGLNVCRGKLTRPEVAKDLGLAFTEAEVALEELQAD